MFAASKTGSGSAGPANYIEDVFSTYLYTGNGSTQTITNDIDLAGKGGLVWLKSRTNPPSPYDDFHRAVDTVRGTNSVLYPNSTSVADPFSYVLTAFNSNGFTIGNGTYDVNKSGYTYASWTFREQPKFFDVVTYTGNGANRTIAHNLGSVPGCIIIKRTDATDNWIVYHRSLGNDNELFLNLTNAINYTNDFNFTTPTSTVFSVNGNAAVNASGGTYVAYLFAHDAGGFGLTGTDNVISCGSYTTNNFSTISINLGYEPQWLLTKRTDAAGDWVIRDVNRGWTAKQATLELGTANTLAANDAAQEYGGNTSNSVTSTGFDNYESGPRTYIYIAIRRGPMKTPTTGTSVFSPNLSVGTTGQQITTNFPVDSQWFKYRNSAGLNTYDFDRLRGVSTTTTESGRVLYLNRTDAEANDAGTRFFNNTGFQQNSGLTETNAWVLWNFRRAPGFFDEVCYTGTGSAGATQTHNLGAVPELMIVKKRSSTGFWIVYSQTLGINNYLILNDAGGANAGGLWGGVAPTASIFTLGSNANINEAGSTFVWYGFATCPGVSKVGSYTGTGALQTVNCGFAAGARFVLIKRTDSTGDWYVWDSARGISSGNDPYLLLNTTAAEVTGTNYVDTTAVGFQVTAAAPAALNASGGTYIFLAIA